MILKLLNKKLGVFYFSEFSKKASRFKTYCGKRIEILLHRNDTFPFFLINFTLDFYPYK